MLYRNTVLIFATFYFIFLSPFFSWDPQRKKKRKRKKRETPPPPITRKMEHLAGVRGKGAKPVGGLCRNGNGPVRRENKIHLYLYLILIIIIIIVIII